MDKDRVNQLVPFLEALPDIDEYRYIDDDGFHVTQEWLCGTFAGRGFVGRSHSEAVEKMADYLDRHIGHKSMVGRIVTESGWPDLDRVKKYITDNA